MCKRRENASEDVTCCNMHTLSKAKQILSVLSSCGPLLHAQSNADCLLLFGIRKEFASRPDWAEILEVFCFPLSIEQRSRGSGRGNREFPVFSSSVFLYKYGFYSSADFRKFKVIKA